MQPRRLLGFSAAGPVAGSWSAWCPPRPTGPFLQSHFPAIWTTACYEAWGCSPPGVWLGFSLCWTSGGSCQPISPTFPHPSDQQHNRLVHQTLHPVIVWKHAECALHPTICVIIKEVKQYWHQHQPLRHMSLIMNDHIYSLLLHILPMCYNCMRCVR